MASGGMRGLCKQQGPLILDKPYPYAQPNDMLPFCNTFSQCTCCNASHALTIQTVLSGAYADTSIPGACREALKTHSCSVCDPWVGTGGKKEYSRKFCNKWFSACSTSFVSQNSKSGELVWCSEDSPALICSRLSEVATNGTELCLLAGVDAVEEDETGAAVTFPERSTDPRGADICEHTANFRRSRYDRSIPSQPQGLVLSTALIQEFLVWVVAFSALLGVLVVLVTRKRKKAQQRAFADSMFTGREGGGNFDSEIIREYKERYYAREKGLEAAMKRSDEDRERDD